MNVPGVSSHNHRFRAIGTGEMIGAVDSSNGVNRLGYAFFGLGSFGGKTNTRYVDIDGVDPLFPTSATVNGNASALCSGFFNTTPAFSCTNDPSFDGVVAGNYRYWNIIRAVYYSSYTNPATGPSVPGLILAAQDQAKSATGPHDFVPFQYCSVAGSGGVCGTGGLVANLPVFRVHYPLSLITSGIASNGNGACEPAENGGDMAGGILPVNTDIATCNLTGGGYFTDYIQ
jgi:hypothetical protein